LPAAKKVLVASEKTAQKTSNTTKGPSVGVIISRPNPPKARFEVGILVALIG
jgi:hypothetical protein